MNSVVLTKLAMRRALRKARRDGNRERVQMIRDALRNDDCCVLVAEMAAAEFRESEGYASVEGPADEIMKFLEWLFENADEIFAFIEKAISLLDLLFLKPVEAE